MNERMQELLHGAWISIAVHHEPSRAERIGCASPPERRSMPLVPTSFVGMFVEVLPAITRPSYHVTSRRHLRRMSRLARQARPRGTTVRDNGQGGMKYAVAVACATGTLALFLHAYDDDDLSAERWSSKASNTACNDPVAPSSIMVMPDRRHTEFDADSSCRRREPSYFIWTSSATPSR